jgi:hypothetical protein
MGGYGTETASNEESDVMCEICQAKGFDATLGCMHCNYCREINMDQVLELLPLIERRLGSAHDLRKRTNNVNDQLMRNICGDELVKRLDSNLTRLKSICKEKRTDREINIDTLKRLSVGIEQHLATYHKIISALIGTSLSRMPPPANDRMSRLEAELSRMRSNLQYLLINTDVPCGGSA